MKTDVFIRCYAMSANDVSPIRTGMAVTTVERWRLQEDINLTVMYPVNDQFHMEGKQRAEHFATSDIYVVADDDCLILGKGFIAGGLYAMDKNPSYGILSAASISDGTWQDYGTEEFPTVASMHSVGGVCFVRKGILTEFPKCDPNQVDTILCEEIIQKGYKTGIMPGLKFNHLGAGYSLTQKGYWGA